MYIFLEHALNIPTNDRRNTATSTAHTLISLRPSPSIQILRFEQTFTVWYSRAPQIIKILEICCWCSQAYENGGSALLLNVQGTLPVKFRDTTYAFPISIWVPQEYPVAGPIGFVTPSQDLTVRPGQHVTVEGKVYHPYLASWQSDVSIHTFFAFLGSKIDWD